MSQIDPTVVLNKLSYMDKYLGELEEFQDITRAQYLASMKEQRGSERLIQLIVQVGIDINFYLLKQIKKTIPEYGSDAAIEIAKLGIIAEPLAARLQASVKMRNLLVHIYEKIEPEQIYGAISEILTDYSQYQRSILQYLATLESEL